MRVLTFFIIFLFCGAAFAKYDRVTGQYYDIYWGDIESLEHGLDGYQDILLKARPNYVPIGVGVNFPVPVDTGFEDILLCGSSSGTFSVCTLSPQATLPPDTAQGFDLLVGDFDADGMVDIFLHSLNVNINSSYLKNSGDGRFSLDDQFISLDGVPVSGNPNVAASGKYGNDADELVIDGIYYSEVKGGRFGEVGGILPIYSLVGASESSFSVEKGTANYSIPIMAPKGGAGIRPSVSLNYSSNGGYGQAGMGFQISGLSSVTRCGKNNLRDGYVRAADGTAQDLACLDGARLVLESGDYWAEGSVYRPERESGSKVIYEGGGFVEYKKNGDVYYYGETNNSRSYGRINGAPVAVWGLNFVSDRLGYGYRIKYLEGYESYLPEEVVYTVQRGSGASGYAEIEFEYEQDPYGNTASVLGKKIDLDLRLSSIKSYSDNQVLRKYYLSYDENDSTGRSLLTSYAECDSSNKCLQPTTFEWQYGPAASFSNAKYIKFPNQRADPGVFEEGLHRAGFNRWADVNRDGIDDYCRISPVGYGDVEIVCYQHNGTSSFSLLAEIPNNLSGTHLPEDPYAYPTWNLDAAWRDINNDGYVDLCISRYYDDHLKAGTDTLQCWINDGEVNTSFDQIVTAEIPRPVTALSTAGRSWNDINGDGELDFCFEYKDSGKNYVSCFLKKQGLFEFEEGFVKEVPDFGGYWSDINGDGLPDFCVVEEDKITCDVNDKGDNMSGGRWVKNGSHFVNDEPDKYVFSGGTTKYFSAIFVDFTGNGYSDFCRIYAHKQNGFHGYRASCLESLGDGWGNDVHSAFIPVVQAYQPDFAYDAMAEATQFMDVNSDGWIDWCIEASLELQCMVSTSQGFGSQITSFTLPDFGGDPEIRSIREVNRGWADINGNGVSSYCVLYWKSAGLEGKVNDRGMGCYDSGSAEKHDYLVGVQNGFGLEYGVEYADISDPGVYEYSRGLGEQGQVFATSGMNVVSKLTTSNGIGGYSEQEYFYKNYGYLPGEIGGLGFEYIKTTSENGNKVGEAWYSQDAYAHQAGRVIQSRTSLTGGSGQRVTIREENNEWETKFYAGLGYEDVSADTIWDGAETANYRLHIPAHRDRPFRLNVTACSGRS